MLERVFSIDKKVSSLGFGGLAVLLLLGGAGCADEADDDITQITSEVRVSGPNGHTYEFRTDAKTFQQAQAFCTTIGFHSGGHSGRHRGCVAAQSGTKSVRWGGLVVWL